jgi:hypothetical protein
MDAAPAFPGSADLGRILADLQSNEVALTDVTAGLSDAELRWQPDNGRGWSILQCVEHLALTNASYTAAMGETLRSPKAANCAGRGDIRPSAAGALFLKKLEPPVKTKVRAPRPLIPTVDKTTTDVLSAFARTHQQIRDLIGTAARLDLNRLRFRNPFLPILRLRVGTAFLIMPAHERRHLWQAKNVRAAVAR